MLAISGYIKTTEDIEDTESCQSCLNSVESKSVDLLKVYKNKSKSEKKLNLLINGHFVVAGHFYDVLIETFYKNLIIPFASDTRLVVLTIRPLARMDRREWKYIIM